MAQLFHDRKQREARSNMTAAQKANTPYIDCTWDYDSKGSARQKTSLRR